MCENTGSKALTMKTVHLSHMMRMLHEERMREMDPSASPGRVGDMAMILGARPRSLEKTLSELAEGGFVSREQGEKRRFDKVRLTDKGREPGCRPQGKVSKIFGTLTDEERGQLAAILDKLNAGFEKELGLPEDPQERRAVMRQKCGG